MSLTKAMGCARDVPVKRRSTDFYPTPAECTVALLREEISFIRPLGRVWEPACGDGAIVRVLQAHGLPTAASDLVDRGCPDAVISNFLELEQPLGQAVITNPPYGSKLPERFVRHALRLGVTYVALFLKADYWCAIDRLQLFHDWQPCAIYPLTWRPDWTGDGSPTMNMAWYVWDLARGNQEFKPLRRPTNDVLKEERPADLPLFAEVG